MTSTNAAPGKKSLLVIFLTVFIDLVGFGIIIPQSPFLAREFGASSLQVGLLMAIYSTLQFLFAPFWGRISDQYGRRPILLMSTLGTAVSHLAFFLAPNLAILFIARGFAGLFGANISTAMAAIADLTGEKDRSKGMGLVGAAFGLGFILGPAISGFVSQWHPTYPPLVAAAIGFLNFLSAYRYLPESLPPEKRGVRKKKSRFALMKEKFSVPVIGALMAGQLLIGLAMANIEAPLFLLVREKFSFSVAEASYSFVYVGLWLAFTQGFLIRKFLPKFGERWMLLMGVLLFAIGLLGIGLSSALWFLTVAVTFLSLGNGLTSPALSGSVSLLSRPEEQGETMGVIQSLAALARILGPPIGGFLYDRMGQATPFYFAALLATLGFWVLYAVRARLPDRARVV